MADWFGRSPGYMSSICTDMVIHLQTRFQAFLHWDQHRLTKEKLRFYARHIDKVGGGDLVWGYVDGTLQKICRPGENQRLYYSGHKHYHGFKFQGVISPDGIFSSFFGPIIGSRGDWYIFGKSGLEEIVERLFEGDAAGRQLTGTQREFNAQMSKKRVSVEHGFGHIQQTWMRNSYHLTLRVGQTPVASYYLAAALLANFMTCLRGNQISRAFQCEPPTLEEYLGVFRRDT
ncbi:hypothetical protein Egran_05130 [Elaphomyces granulatus]|uniref:DDE Tnp4 domain-containing protein n=1 Tax=Elaphomyces granulatus TaxID=519963 RepID=A0A232LSI0_9EURO|nr:hypothetical protein Egran_05130 [Elaphomyces granulatus]